MSPASDYSPVPEHEEHISMADLEYKDNPASSPLIRPAQWNAQQRPRARSNWLLWVLPLSGFAVGALFSAGLISTETVSIPDTKWTSPKQGASAIAAAQRMKILKSTDALPRDIAYNLAFTDEECDAAFPLLWPEVNATAAAFAKEGITREHLAAVDAYDGTTLAIIDNQLYIKRFHGEYMKRNEAVIASLYQAIITSPVPFPDVEFWFRGTDELNPGGWFALNKKPGDAIWLLPDFGFYSWPEPGVKGWLDFRRRAEEVESKTPWAQKENKLFFRGAMLSTLRQKLLALSEANEWGDVRDLDWSKQANRIEMEDHCKHKYLASIEGRTAYSGRLKYLMHCRSVVISHKMQWTQHFHGALVSEGPGQNIVELPAEGVEGGWTDLPEVMEKLIGDEEFALNIADNALRTMKDRYLTPAATTCYWRRVLTAYAGLQKFTPEIGKGVDYESFSLLFRTEWRPYK